MANNDLETRVWAAVRELQLQYRGQLKTSHAIMIVKHHILSGIEKAQAQVRNSTDDFWKGLFGEGIGFLSYQTTKRDLDELIAAAERSEA